MEFFFRYVTIQRGNRPSSDDDEASSNRFGGGSRTRGNINQVGSSSISRFGSAQSAFRTRLRQPRDRVAALRESANRRRRSPDTLSIVYPSPSLNELEDQKPASEEIIPALPVQANINYVFPASQSHIREKKQINVPLDVEESRKVEEKAEYDDNDDYDGWEILDTDVEQSVSQSVSVSKSFSVSQILSDIVDYVVTTISPLTADGNSEEVVTTETIEVETSTEEEAELESTTTTAIKIETEKPATKKLSDLFKPRVHPFLASKSTTTTTTEPPTTRRSFLLKKTTETTSKVEEEEEENEESTEKDVDLKLMKMMNILNNRDAMKEDNEVISEKATTTEKADFLLSNRNERPKFQVPPSLQAKLKQDVVVESATPKASPKDDKKIITPLKLFNKPTLLRPFKSKSADSKPKSSINSKPIELPRKNPIRTNKPLDLDVSPSSTITRSRTSLLRRPSGLSESNSRTVFSTTSTTTTVAPSTEKLTVGDILAGLHGGPQQPEPKTFSRQHSFKPKSDNHNKLRAKLRKTFEQNNSSTPEPVGQLDAKAVTELLEEAKEELQPEAVETPSRLSNARRVRPNRLERPTAVRPAAVQQETLPRTRRPVSSRQPLRARPQQVPKVQQQEQQPQEEVEELIGGQRVLSGDDLLSSLGLMDDDKVEKTTAQPPSEQPLGILESLFESKGSSGPPVAFKAEDEPQEQQQSPPSLEAILKSAVVDSLDVPIPIKEEKRKQAQVRPRPPPLASRPSTSSRSRSRARITNPIHRFRPTTQGEVASTTETATRSAVINNRRLRVRQRGRGSSSSAAAEAVTSTPAVTLDNAVPSTEAVIPSTRSSSRFSNRRRIVNRGRTSSASSTASTTSKSVEIPSTSRNVAAFGTRTSNLRTSDRINNRVRVRSRARQPVRGSSSPIENEENEESAIETVKEPLSQPTIEAIPATPNETKPGKLTEESVENIVIEEETEEENSEAEEAAEVTLRPGNFRPRFGTKQRNAVRNKLRAQLQDDNEVTSEEVDTTRDETTSEAPTFKTVSPSEGLASLPISFFTTPQRFVPTSGTTESPSTTSEVNFLPTLTPLQRVGRSTVGYTDEPPTKRPKFNALRRKGSRPKFGQKFTTVSPSEAEDTGVSFGISTTLLPTTLGNNRTSAEETTTEKIQVEDLKKEESQRKNNGGNSNFSFFKRRGNFLKSLDKKIEHIKYTEKALLDSFGGPQKSKNQISGRVSFGNFDLKNSLKRPRRRFNQASKSDDSNEVLEEKIKVNHNASDIKASEDENASIKVVDLTTTTQLPLLENVIEGKKKPKIPVPPKKFELPKGLPKGFKLPKFNFGALQPKLLSFKIIRTTPSTTSTTTETSTTISSGSTEVTPPDTTSSSSKKLAFKDKLKFGRRKTFGSLLKSKRPKLLPSFLPTPAPTTTTLGTSTPIPTPEETQVDFRGINQANK